MSYAPVPSNSAICTEVCISFGIADAMNGNSTTGAMEKALNLAEASGNKPVVAAARVVKNYIAPLKITNVILSV